jgi:hypothetical protein
LRLDPARVPIGLRKRQTSCRQWQKSWASDQEPARLVRASATLGKGSDLGTLGGSRTPDLQIRSSMCGHPFPFRSVRDLECLTRRLFIFVRASGSSFVPVAPSVAPESHERARPLDWPGIRSLRIGLRSPNV